MILKNWTNFSKTLILDSLSDYDLRALEAYIISPSGAEEPCYLKKLPKVCRDLKPDLNNNCPISSIHMENTLLIV